jgi:geranylgeranyl diphosphate synthase, type II
MISLDKYIHGLKQELDKYNQSFLKKTKPKYLYDPIYYSIDNGGKKIRPSILFLASEYSGETNENTFKAALSIEYFHIFSLVHDDIMDHDEFRRGKETIHKKWDSATAILAGDGLIALSNILMMSISHPRLNEILKSYSETILSVCEGQAFDKEFEKRSDVSIDEYIQMISLKTAWLIGSSAKIGAILSSDKPEIWDTFYDIAFNLGIAFQIQDDILDLYADQEQLGKDIASDIFNQKNSVLTIYARESSSIPEQADLEKSRSFINGLKENFEKNGVLERSISLKNEYYNIALSKINTLKSNDIKTLLLELSQKLNSRNF